MRKLSVILLASVFVFGLAAQAGAAVTEVDESAFAGDEIITFDYDDGLSRDMPITTQYESRGVVFSEGWYLEDFFSILYWGMPYAAGNINLNDFGTTQTPIRMNFVDPVTRVGFDILSLEATEVIVTVYRDGAETDRIYRDTGSKMFIGVDDPEGIDAIEISANGYFSILTDFVVIDNLTFGGVPKATRSEMIKVAVDIKPGNCMNPLNVKSRGKVPVIIIGSADFDVSQIDPDSIRLSIPEASLEDSMQSATALRERLDDVGYCSVQEPDGFQDLKLKFDTQELVAAVEYSLGVALEDGQMLVLQLSGNLYEEYGGTQIIGEDSVAVLAKTKQKKHWKKHRKKHWKKHWKKKREK